VSTPEPTYEVFRQDNLQQQGEKVGFAHSAGEAVAIACAFYQARQAAGENPGMTITVNLDAEIVAFIGASPL